MSKSLQDQLLSANLIDPKKAKKISKENRKSKNIQRRSIEDKLSEIQAAVEKNKQEKLVRDNELNQQKNRKIEKRAIAAQVVQMIEHYRLKREIGDVEYYFTDGQLVKKLCITAKLSEEIVRGRLCIAKLNEIYEIIPRPIAEKIQERDVEAIIVFNKTSSDLEKSTTESDDDYYAQFKIPDDLDW